MDIIANKKIENLPFDKTILCTVKEVIDSEEGIYEVSFSESNAKITHFQAFAQENATYEEGDNVYVNVPQNDFSNQKTIIRKYITDQTKPINYINPMEQFIHAKNYYNILLIGANKDTGAVSLKANDETRSEKLIWEQTFDIAEMPNQFDRLGISATFQSLLSNYHIAPGCGNYGLRLEFIGLKDGWEESNWKDNINKLSEYMVFKTSTFDYTDMYGNSYDSNLESEQEKLINLEDFPYPIRAMRIYFFQDNNFKDLNDQDIPVTVSWETQLLDNENLEDLEDIFSDGNESESNIKLADDLFVSDISFAFGYAIGEAYDKELRLYTTSSKYYAEDKDEQKTLKLRWLEANDDGNFTIIDELTDKNDEENFWNYKSIYLYKYTYGKDDPDQYAGPFWEEVEERSWHPLKWKADPNYKPQLKDKNNENIPESLGFQEADIPILPEVEIDKKNSPFDFTISITDKDKQSAFIKYKMIIVETSLVETTGKTYNSSLDTEDKMEEITYYIVQEDIYESNEITFDNRDQVASMATMALIQGLELKCSDGTNGIYRIYGQDNKISAQINSREMKLDANFKAINILGIDLGKTSITWYYPKNKTMLLKPVDEGERHWTENPNYPDYYILEEEISPDTPVDKDSVDNVVNSINYTISSFYSTLLNNNTIKCVIERYGRKYEAEIAFSFGHQGNNGTNYSFDIALEREYGFHSSPDPGPSSHAVANTLRYNNGEWIKIVPTLIYGQERIEDLSNIRWSWESISTHTSESESFIPDISVKIPYESGYKEEITSSSGYAVASEIYIRYVGKNAENYYAILKAEIPRDIITEVAAGDSEGADKARNITLATYLPIPLIVNGGNVTYSGGTSIIYNDYGSDPVYYEGEHKLFVSEQQIENLTWSFNQSDGEGANKYYPSMYKKETDSDSITSNEWYLRPTSMFFSGLKNTGRIVAQNASDGIIYIQPIFIAQNAWGNQTINQWDGALKIDNDNNYILSAMLGAGVKDSENRFSGVLLGKVGTDYSAKTGIYGYGEGVQTYGFREDGTAFIGASGAGRIEFDTKNNVGTIKGGQNATLKNAKKNDGYTMTIDLTQGSLIGIQNTSHNKLGTYGNSKGHELYRSKNINDTNEYYKVGEIYKTVFGDTEYSGNSTDLEPEIDYYQYTFNAQANQYPLEIGEKFKVAWDGTLYANNAIIGNAFGDLWNNISENDSGEITLEEYLYTVYHTLNQADIKQAEKEAEDLAAEAAARAAADAAESIERASGDLSERMAREYEFEPNQLYNSIIRASTDGSGNKYLMVANTTYGSGSSETKFLLDGSDGTLCVNNLVANGVITGYAGSFGGWNLLPGLMYYGYNTSAIQTQQGFKWIGDFFTLPTGITIDNNNTQVNLEVFKNLQFTTNPFVSVDSQKSFMFLGNSGNGIGVINFAGNPVPSGATVNDNYFSSSNEEKSQPNNGRLKNIIFSLGKYFAVDKDGQLFASSGTFSGTIKANAGEIGGLTIAQNTITSKDVNNSGNGYLYLNPNVKNNASTTTALQVGSNFIVKADGTIYANALRLGTDGSQTTVEGLAASTAQTTTNNTISTTLFGGGTVQNIITYVKSDDSFVYFDKVAPNGSATAPTATNSSTSIDNYFKVEKNGLLTATNAVIYGTVYSSAGDIGGWKLADGYIYNSDGPTSLTDYGKVGIHLNSGSITNTIPGINIVLDNPGSKNIYTTDYSGSSLENPFENVIALVLKIWDTAFGSNSIQKITPKFFIREKNQENIWSGLNQYGLIISDTAGSSKLKSFYGKDLMVGGNTILASTTYIKQLRGTQTTIPKNSTSPFDFTKGWNQTITYYDNRNWYSSQNETITTTAIGLSLNTTDTTNNFWRNSFYTILKNYNPRNISSYYYPMKSDFIVDNYVAFIRGFGSDSSQPSQVYLGIKKHTSSIDGLTDSTDWDAADDYLAYIRYNGEASFSAITLNGSKIIEWPGGGVSLPANSAGLLKNNGSGTLSWDNTTYASQSWVNTRISNITGGTLTTANFVSEENISNTGLTLSEGFNTLDTRTFATGKYLVLYSLVIRSDTEGQYDPWGNYALVFSTNSTINKVKDIGQGAGITGYFDTGVTTSTTGSADSENLFARKIIEYSRIINVTSQTTYYLRFKLVNSPTNFRVWGKCSYIKMT